MYFSLKKIKDSLPAKKNSKSSLWVKTVVRKLSFLFTFAFINLGCSAWMASIISVLVACAGAVCLCINSPVARIVGVILIELWLVLDCVDGNIARVRRTSSEMGEFIDALSGYYVTGFVYFAIGISAFYTTSMTKFAFLWVILGGMSSICGLLARIIHQKYTYTLLVLERRNCEKVELPEDEVTNKKSIQYLRSRVDKEISISGLFMPFLLIALVFNLYDIMTIFYFLFQLVGLMAVTVYYSIKAK